MRQPTVSPAPVRTARLPDELLRIVRFCEVGATNTVLTLAAYAALVAAGCPPWASSALAFAAGAVNGYHWNARWTFAGHGAPPARARRRYVAVQGLGSAASALGVGVAHGALGLGHLPAELGVLPCVTAVTYALMRSVVFAGGPAPSGSVPA